MVSNAVDATQKLKTLSATGDFKGELGDLSVRVSLDEKAGTLTISDCGIGMTAEEIEKYINQIAFSGVNDFLEKYQDKAEAIMVISVLDSILLSWFQRRWRLSLRAIKKVARL